MGHPSNKVVGMPSDVVGHHIGVSGNKICDVCVRAKQTRESFLLSENNAKENFELIHCDLWGPYRVVASSGASYFLTIVDDFSRSVWIYLLNAKTTVSSTLRNFFCNGGATI